MPTTLYFSPWDLLLALATKPCTEEIAAQACAHQTPGSAKEEQIALKDYGMKPSDLQGAQFNKMRNYLGAQVSMMYANSLASHPNGLEQLRKLVNTLIVK